MTAPVGPLRARPEKPFTGKIIVQIMFDAADPNSDGRIWQHPDEIQTDIEERIDAHAETMFVAQGNTGFLHDSWIKGVKAKVTVVQEDSPKPLPK